MPYSWMLTASDSIAITVQTRAWFLICATAIGNIPPPPFPSLGLWNICWKLLKPSTVLARERIAELHRILCRITFTKSWHQRLQYLINQNFAPSNTTDFIDIRVISVVVAFLHMPRGQPLVNSCVQMFCIHTAFTYIHARSSQNVNRISTELQFSPRFSCNQANSV